MLDVDFIEAQIQEMTDQEQIHFANWQRVQGAKLAYQQMLAQLEQPEAEKVDVTQPESTEKAA